MSDPAKTRSLTLALSAALALSLVLLAASAGGLRPPGNDRGFEPEQPIRYSHRLHAGELGISCLYCHSGAERSRAAGIPPASVCMNCHGQVGAPFLEIKAETAAAAAEGRKARELVSPEIAKLRDAVAKDEPIIWTRVHNLPDFAYFDHRPHVTAGLACQTCHGPVETMERMRQHADLSMGWCVDCHRTSKVESPLRQWPRRAPPAEARASTDCGACHF